MIKQIGPPIRVRPILLITRMNTDRIVLHSVLLPLLITSLCSVIGRVQVETYCITMLAEVMTLSGL